MTKDKLLFANLTTKQTYLEWGRIFFSVLNTFTEAGYSIELLDNEALHKLDVYGKPVFDLKNLTVVKQVPTDTENYSYLYDKKDNQLNNAVWEKQVFLRFNLYASYCFEEPMIMPFPVHPLQEIYGYIPRLPELRQAKRNLRILFAGDIDQYRRTWVTHPQEKLPRQEIIETIKEQLAPEKLHIIANEASFTDAMQAEFINKFVIIDNDSQRIDNKLWLDTLAKSQFFFSPPGIVMPMCHNITEAMAIGCIPITNYPEWLHPNLEHGVNCIVFDTKRDLLEQIDAVLAMDDATILQMKNNAIAYYEQHLKKAAFMEKLEAKQQEKVTVLYYTEGNTAFNTKKLNKHSVLMRDTTVPIKPSGLRYQIMKYLGRV
ncbi:MAG: hypothetical protein GQ581_03895 [Methyloprofundus sp.]|nr:hypothetical protein [Methyloprofundus sp.]